MPCAARIFGHRGTVRLRHSEGGAIIAASPWRDARAAAETAPINTTRRQRLTRLATEGLVIVASILLAFAIDAWWDQRQADERRLEYLDALEGEFTAAREEMLEQIHDHTRQLEALDALLRGLATGAPEGELLPRLRSLYALYVYGPAHPVFNDLANAGAIDVLESAELRFALLRYGQASDFLAALARREAELWHGHMHPYLIERTDILPQSHARDIGDLEPRFPSGLDTLYEDRTFQNMLLRRRPTIEGQLGMNQDVPDAIEAVLAETTAAQ